jgi:hypothetical protein
MTKDKDFGIPAELLQAAVAAAAQALTPSALRERFGPPANWQILPGQLWRAAWDDVTLLVLIVSAAAEAVTAAPATVEPAAEDEESLIVDSRRTALDEPITIWGGLVRQLRLEVLDRPIDAIGADVAAWVTDKSSVPSGCRAGVKLASPFEADIEVRAVAADDMGYLADAKSWAAGIDYAPAAGPAAIAPPSRGQLVELHGRLGLPLPDVLALVDGRRPPTAPEEIAALREVLGRVPHVRAPAKGLVAELSHPRWRPAARAFARQSDRSEPEARLAMAYEISGASMAARQTGDQEPAWRDRVQRWVQAHRLEDAG